MSKQSAPWVGAPFTGPVQRFDLEAEVGRLREEGLGTEGSATPSRCARAEGMNVVLVVREAGDRLEEHAAPGPLQPKRP